MGVDMTEAQQAKAEGLGEGSQFPAPGRGFDERAELRQGTV
jgi:hypothetical protein